MEFFFIYLVIHCADGCDEIDQRVHTVIIEITAYLPYNVK